jgi:hypothetical protein
MPYKSYVTGDILTAADANDNFMEQTIATFDNAAARGTAITAPNEGQYSYLRDTDMTEIYNGTNWVSASNSINAGSTLISSTTFTAASGVSVNSCFTSTYDAYLISFYGSQPTSPRMFMRLGGTDSVAGYYDFTLATSGATGTVVTGSAQQSVAIGWKPFAMSGQSQIGGQLVITNPAVATTTSYSASPTSFSNSGPSSGINISAGYHNVSTAYDGFSLTFGSSTGWVRVYGLKK